MHTIMLWGFLLCPTLTPGFLRYPCGAYGPYKTQAIAEKERKIIQAHAGSIDAFYTMKPEKWETVRAHSLLAGPILRPPVH